MRARMNIGPIKPGKKEETIAFFRATLDPTSEQVVLVSAAQTSFPLSRGHRSYPAHRRQGHVVDFSTIPPDFSMIPARLLQRQPVGSGSPVGFPARPG